jgi:lipopolysaccharide transport system permease protein
MAPSCQRPFEAPAYPAAMSATVQAREPFVDLSWIAGYRELLWTMLRRELRVKYKGSALGIVWSYLYPLAMMGVYTLVFSVLLKAVSIPHYSLYVLIGLAAWSFFQAAVQMGTSSIVSNANLVRNVWFPRELVPLATTLAQAFSALIMFAVLVPITLVIVPHAARTAPLAIPFLLGLLLLAAGLGWILATANVFFRDVEHLIGVLFLPWFFLTPILYSLDNVPGAAEHGTIIHVLRYANPVTPYIEGIRGAMLQGQVPGVALFVYAAVVAPVVALVGLWVIQRYADRFAAEV